MKKKVRTLLVAGLLWSLQPSTALAQTNPHVVVRDGRVSISARNTSVHQILSAWARAGGMVVVNSERLSQTPITIELVDVGEVEALRTLLRSASGYVAVARGTVTPASSVFDRVTILATSSAPPTTAGRTPPPGYPAAGQFPQAPLYQPALTGFGPPPGATPPPGFPPGPGFPNVIIDPSGVQRLIDENGIPVPDDQDGVPPPPANRFAPSMPPGFSRGDEPTPPPSGPRGATPAQPQAPTSPAAPVPGMIAPLTSPRPTAR